MTKALAAPLKLGQWSRLGPGRKLTGPLGVLQPCLRR